MALWIRYEVLDAATQAIQPGFGLLEGDLIAVCRGEMFLTQSISRTIVQAFLQNTPVPGNPISDRERQVLQLVAEGKTTKEIASFLGISVKTAESHRSNLMDKLNIHDTAGLVRYAIRIGLIES